MIGGRKKRGRGDGGGVGGKAVRSRSHGGGGGGMKKRRWGGSWPKCCSIWIGGAVVSICPSRYRSIVPWRVSSLDTSERVMVVVVTA